MHRAYEVEPRGIFLLRLGLALAAKDHPVRQRLLAMLADEPGLHLREIARRLDLPQSHAEHHLRALLKVRLVTSDRDAGYLRFWPTKETRVGRMPALSPAERDLVRFLRRPTALRMLVHLAFEAPLSLTDLASRCGVAPSTAHYHLRRLAKAGLVGAHDHKGRPVWEPRDPVLLKRVLAEYEPPGVFEEGFLGTWDRLAP